MEKLNYHFIGIGGVSMSALAKILWHNGHNITGSDINTVKFEFAKTFVGHKAENIDSADIVVFNSAIKEDNPELAEAKKQGKKIFSRAELLAEISKEYETVIAVAGMHGKSTTTEMLAECFSVAGKNPTVHIGAVSNFFDSNVLLGDKKYFITEACEYTDSFLTLNPDISVILNVEEEHLDYFKNYNNICSSFQKFASQSGEVICENNLKIKKNNKKIKKFNKNNYLIAKNIKKIGNKLSFDLIYKNKFKEKIILNSIIEKNIENALAVFLVCKSCGVDIRYFKKTMKTFKGIKRRMEIIQKNPLIIHDYAHHPTEIKSVIQSVRDHFRFPISLVFQPHTFSRTESFFNEFVDVLSMAENIVLLKTYSAREKEIKGASGYDLFLALKNKKNNKKNNKKLTTNSKVNYFEDFETAKNFILANLQNNVTLILGAGDVEDLANLLK